MCNKFIAVYTDTTATTNNNTWNVIKQWLCFTYSILNDSATSVTLSHADIVFAR